MTNLFSVVSGHRGTDFHHARLSKVGHLEGINVYLALFIKSNAVFLINGEKFLAKPYSIIIFSPGCSFQYYNPDGEYINDYFRFKCSDASFFTKKDYPFNKIIFPKDRSSIEILFQEIVWDQLSYDQYEKVEFKENVSLMIHVLLNRWLISSLQQTNDKYSPYYGSLRQLRIELQSNIDAPPSPEEIAKNIGISTSTFRQAYKSLFGISYNRDIITIRINYAKFLIGSTNYSLNTISQMVGYTSEVHFFRQFKKETGRHPSDFRNLLE